MATLDFLIFGLKARHPSPWYEH